MIGSGAGEVMEHDKPDDSKKKGRRRRKQLYQNLRQQMEFYFSDANLAKDRFLSQSIEEKPWVPLEVFLTFNKINSMVKSVAEIAKALRDSEVLELSDDGLGVRRKTPFSFKENEDDCTIYVENLAPETTHESLTKVFSEFGKVVYVSIPKFRNTQTIKGFAFVEFNSPQDAANTLEVFREKGSCLSAQMLPEKLCSIKTFEDPNAFGNKSEDCKSQTKEEIKSDVNSQQSNKQKGIIKSGEGDTSEYHHPEEDHSTKKRTKSDAEELELEHNHRKRRKSGTCVELHEQEVTVHATEPESHKMLEVQTSDLKECSDLVEKEKKCKRKQRHVSDSSEHSCDTAIKKEEKSAISSDLKPISQGKNLKRKTENQDELKETGGEDDKTKRQRLKSEGEVSDSDDETNLVEGGKKKSRRKKKKPKEETDVFASGLHVLSKKEWKRLRNKYLNMQRLHMKKVKLQLIEARFMRRTWGNAQNHMQPHAEPNSGHSEEGEPVVSTTEQSKPRIAFTPGVIIRVRFNEPVVEVKNFKAEARAQPSVQYVDIHEGACEAYLRCSTSSDAQALLQTKRWDQMTLIQGDEENAYWDKIFKDREDKIGKKVRPKKERGRKKLIRKVEAVQATHLHFDT